MGQKVFEVVWGKRAIRQLQNAFEYIANESFQNALKVRAGNAETLLKAAANPERFAPDKYKKANSGLRYRYFNKYHYRVSYKIGKSSIKVIRIRHTKMKPGFY